MGKKKDYQLNGQLCFDFNTNTEHYVVQSNEDVYKRQAEERSFYIDSL